MSLWWGRLVCRVFGHKAVRSTSPYVPLVFICPRCERRVRVLP